MRLVLKRSIEAAVLAIVVLGGAEDALAQTMYRSGQSVQPVYEGWERNPDGTYTMWFGYMNRNYVEEPHLPIGEQNHFSPGPADRGQPTHFYTRRQLFMFSTVLPAEWGDQELVWTIRHEGQDYTAVGRLLDPNWGVDEGVWRANRANAFRGRTSEEFVNRAPSVTIEGAAQRSARVGEPLTLRARADDDARPGPAPAPARPQQAGTSGATELPIVNFVPTRQAGAGPTDQGVVDFRAARPTGLAVTWLHHRGPGEVTFSPRTSATEPGGEVTTQVVFSQPGSYVIRAAADDTSFIRYADVTVEVSR
jgi:hypothetical protein